MNCIPLEKLIKEWTEDSVVDQHEPGKELLKIPVLHAKYVTQITAHSVALKMKKFEYQKLKKLKIDYYNGRMDEAALKKLNWEPFRFILKTDIHTYMEGDIDLINEQQKMIANEEAVSFCTMVVKELNNRVWEIKDYISWEKFISGA